VLPDEIAKDGEPKFTDNVRALSAVTFLTKNADQNPSVFIEVKNAVALPNV